MNIGIVGGGINGLCTAWHFAKQGDQVRVYERDKLMQATSGASSKLLHGGLRYLENAEFRLVREALRERDAWLQRAPEWAKPMRLIFPIYQNSRRGKLTISAGMFLYDYIAGRSLLPKARWLSVHDIFKCSPQLNALGLVGGYEFSDAQMDDHALGQWVADQAKQCGVEILEDCEVSRLDERGNVTIAGGQTHSHHKVINIAGPWAKQLLDQSEIKIPYQLDLVRGSHLVLEQPCTQAYLLEVPGERRIFFVLPWKGKTLLGTTEVRQSLDQPIVCSEQERDYLLAAYKFYWPEAHPQVIGTFAGLRPLLKSAENPNKATREYVIHRTDNLVTVLGGKWTTAMALAEKVRSTIQ